MESRAVATALRKPGDIQCYCRRSSVPAAFHVMAIEKHGRCIVGMPLCVHWQKGRRLVDFALSEEHRRLQERCRELAADFAIRSSEHDRDASHPIENYDRLRQEGFLELSVPKEHGGAGVGFLGHTVAYETLGASCPSTALSFNMHASGCANRENGACQPAYVRSRWDFQLLLAQRTPRLWPEASIQRRPQHVSSPHLAGQMI